MERALALVTTPAAKEAVIALRARTERRVMAS